MNELIDKIEDSISQLLKYETKEFGKNAQDIVNVMMTLLPAIISIYNNPQMDDIRADAVYWPGQVERIIKVLENDDSFEIIDVLYNETHANLMELRDLLVERGLL
ncbi:MAG: hypothetical protein K6F93_06350 [Lachnospiraceae bacterium]|nr:hypothetical protein [Lachnospiraceae bacterium]